MALFGFGFSAFAFGQLSKPNQEPTTGTSTNRQNHNVCRPSPIPLDWRSAFHHREYHELDRDKTKPLFGSEETLQESEKLDPVRDTDVKDNHNARLQMKSDSDASHLSLAETKSESPINCVAKQPYLKHVTIGWDHFHFLDDDGRLASSNSWNSAETQLERYSSVASSWNAVYLVDKRGQCQLAIPGQELTTLSCVNSDTNLTHIASGENHVIAIDDKAQVHLLQKDTPLFKPITSPNILVKSVSCGHEHVILLSKIGIVFTFGSGSRGQLGHGTIESQTQPQIVVALEGMTMTTVSAGGWHSAALSDIGDVYTWGWNERGQLGARSKGVQSQAETPCKSESVRPAKIQKTHAEENPTNCQHEEEIAETVNVQSIPSVLDVEDENSQLLSFKDISCGSRHSAAISDEGNLYTWGWNDYGQLGLNDRTSRDAPTQVTYFSGNVIKVRCGYWNTIVECCLPSTA